MRSGKAIPRSHAKYEGLLAAQVQLIQGALDATGWKPTQLAKAAALAPSTINRVMAGKATSVISSMTLASIFGAVERRLRELGEPEDRNWIWLRALNSWRLNSALSRPLPAVKVRGRVEAGVWREAAEWEDDDHYGLNLPVEPRFAGKAFGLEVHGKSMDEKYPEGAIVICVSYYELGRDPRPKDKVICYQHRRDGLIEATVKEFVIDENGRRWLVPRSSDPRFQSIPLDQADGDVERIEIAARVVGSYRPEDPE